MKLFTVIFEVLSKILGLVEKKQRRQEKEDAQKENDRIERDPAGWFIDEFNGVRDASELSDDAESTSQTKH
jgi:hypothetical protein